MTTPSTSPTRAPGHPSPEHRLGRLLHAAGEASGSWWPWRAVGGALLLVSSAVHLYLYAGEQYHEIPTVGPLFLMTGIVAVVLALCLAGRRPFIDLFAAAFALSVFGGYMLTLYLPNGLFLFKEPGISYSGAFSIVAEIGGAGCLLIAGLPPLVRSLRSAT